MLIGEMKITGCPVSCLDLSALRGLHEKSRLPQLDGLIGSDLLIILRAQMDYDSRKLTIKRPTRIPERGGGGARANVLPGCLSSTFSKRSNPS